MTDAVLGVLVTAMVTPLGLIVGVRFFFGLVSDS